MDRQMKKVLGIVCLVVCAICVFVAIERYSANSSNVRAINSFQQSTGLGEMMGGAELKPATPAATKYALLFAVLSGIGGVVLLVQSGSANSRSSAGGGDV